MSQPSVGAGTPGPSQPPAVAGVTYCSRCGAQLVGRVQYCHRCGAAVGGGSRSKVAAALLAFFLGGFGAHKFYLGKVGWGIAYLLLCCTGIPALVSFVEFILLLAMSDEDFQARYPGQAPGPAFLVVAVAVVPMLAVTGILAAIAIPNFLRYQLRSKASGTTPELIALMNAEVKRANSGAGVYAFPALPAEPPGPEKRAPSAEEMAIAAELGWALQPTYVQFRVAVNSQRNLTAASFCAETDLDGDGKHAAAVGFLPVMGADRSIAVAPPDAPCSDAAVIGPQGVAFRPEWANRAVPVSPGDVF